MPGVAAGVGEKTGVSLRAGGSNIASSVSKGTP